MSVFSRSRGVRKLPDPDVSFAHDEAIVHRDLHIVTLLQRAVEQRVERIGAFVMMNSCGNMSNVID